MHEVFPTGCAASWLLLVCLAAPSLFAQKREDILSIQRDVAQLQDQVKQLQTSQDQKLAELESLIKQALDQSNQASASMTALQRTLTDRLNDQQARWRRPLQCWEPRWISRPTMCARYARTWRRCRTGLQIWTTSCPIFRVPCGP